MTAEQFRDELADLLNEAMGWGVPIDEIIGAMEICKVMAVSQYMRDEKPQDSH